MDLKPLSASTRLTERKWIIGIALLSLAGAVSAAVVIPNLFPFLDPTGVSTCNATGPIKENNAFFESLGPTDEATTHRTSAITRCRWPSPGA